MLKTQEEKDALDLSEEAREAFGDLQTTTTLSAIEYPPLTLDSLEAIKDTLIVQKFQKLRRIEIGDYVTFKKKFLDEALGMSEVRNVGSIVNILYGVEVRLNALVPTDEVHLVDGLGRVFKKFKLI